MGEAVPKTEVEEQHVKEFLRKLQLSLFGMVLSMCMMMPTRAPVVTSLLPGQDSALAGSLVARMAAAGGLVEFLTLPIVGKLSDQVGRKPMLGLSLGLSSATRLLAFANRRNLRLILAERVVTTAADTWLFTIIRAALSDVVQGEKLALTGPKLAAAAGLGVIGGPVLSLATQKATGSFASVYLISGAVALLNALNVLTSVPESLKDSLRKPFSWQAANPFTFVEMLFSSPTMTKLFTVFCLQTTIDGRNTSDIDFAFWKSELGWTDDETSRFVIVAGFKILLGGALGPLIVKKVGVDNITTFSNVVNASAGFMVAAVPTAIAPLAFFSLLGDRKRDAVESMATELGVRCGYGKGQIAASMSNARAVVCIVAPLIFSAAYSYGVARKKRMGSMAPATQHFVVAALISVLAEAVFRTLSNKELAEAKKESPGKQV